MFLACSVFDVVIYAYITLKKSDDEVCYDEYCVSG